MMVCIMLVSPVFRYKGHGGVETVAGAPVVGEQKRYFILMSDFFISCQNNGFFLMFQTENGHTIE